MNRTLSIALVLVPVLAAIFCPPAYAQSDRLHVYGYFATRFEKTYNEPRLDNGDIVEETPVGEWNHPSLNIMMQHQLDKKFRVFLNLNGAGGGEIDLRNFWGEYSASRYVNVRLGKIYRKFGLYNELLDAVPTYYGIEPPELFDSDHLIVSRTTTLMLHGSTDLHTGVLNYAISTDNGEGDAFKNALPMAYDLRYRTSTGLLTVGTSGYSSFGSANSDVALGEGSPKSGVLPWMAKDDFWVLGGCAELNHKGWTVQTEYWHASHDAERDPEATYEMIGSGSPSAAQIQRFTAVSGMPSKAEDINPDGDYQVDTWYVRTGYSIDSRMGEFGPYMQYDYYSNPETIAEKTYGGDNEAGASDDGKFQKWTLGLLFRPIPQVALKLDGSRHNYKLGNRTVGYPEIRFDVSYIF